jgi:hypothetical protein
VERGVVERWDVIAKACSVSFGGGEKVAKL